MAWWGVQLLEQAVQEHGLPAGRPGTCRLAVADGSRVRAATVPVRLVDLDSAVHALRTPVPPDEESASLRTWREAVRMLDDDDAFAALGERMPAAAHGALNAEGTAIVTPTVLLTEFRQALRARAALRSTTIHATLRPYQQHGVAWLTARPRSGQGGVLADEMGLGKTLQAICLLASRRTVGPHLVVCPTSLIGNWRRELARFSPDTVVVSHHGAQRKLPSTVPPGAVVITSYPVLRRDTALTRTRWDVVILDEAQQIKNPDAQVSRAAAKLTATAAIAMTGTPVENRLDELWAILHVTNPGLLGSRNRFRQLFVTPIEQRRSATAAAALHTLIQPHLLRRTKADVAADLPPKLYSTVVCTLSDEQARLYRKAVDRAFSDGFGVGIARRGRVLALLTELKQICNHPAQYLREEKAELGRSGKFDRAAEMLAEIVDDGERALVFTQYRAMGELLADHLTETLGAGPTPFLHGGLSAGRREELVRDFQESADAPPVLLLSLRAAGFGLNLTRATHVMHYDRWWNPAVEEQATDRAHRIGQRRGVTVHTLVTGGTLEDHIAAMHENKRGFAKIALGRTDAALARLSDEELHAVIDLDSGALA
ncbi:DEAD/DEAH box helicase [Micromonospora sp. KC213]|nr:DEAD/DEAH box helicase [Micromonospora sp. KC213]